MAQRESRFQKFNQKKYAIILAFFEILLLMVLALFTVNKQREEYQLPVTGVTTSEDNTVYQLKTVQTLKKGSYTVLIDYKADNLGDSMIISDENEPYCYLLSDFTMDLPQNKKQVETHIWVTSEINNLQIKIQNTGEGKITVNSIVVYENTAAGLTGIFYLFVIMAILDLFALKKIKKILFAQDDRKIYISLFFLACFSALPLFTNYFPVIEGHDFLFHLVRMEGIKDGLLAGQFPVRINPLYLGGYGYATPIFYPELFLYIPAILRLTGMPIMYAYKIFLFLINLATVYITYYCLNRLFKDKWVAFVGSMVYVLAAYRLTDLLVRYAAGEALALTFFPLIIYGFYRILFDDVEDKKYKYSFIPAVLGFTGLLQSHLLSCLMVAVFAGIALLIMIKRVLVKKRFFSLVKTVLWTVALNLWFIVPFLDFSRLEMSLSKIGISNIQDHGLYLTQFLSDFADSTGQSYWVGWGISGDMPLNIGLPVIIGTLLFVVFYYEGKNAINSVGNKNETSKWRKLGILFIMLGALALWMTTYVFPWNRIARLSPIIDSIVSMIQFPWRFLAPATVFFTFVTCAGMKLFSNNDKQKTRTYVMMMGALVLITSMYFMGSLIKNATTVRVYDSTKLDTFTAVANGEYLPVGTDITAIQTAGDAPLENPILTTYKKNGTTIRCQIDNSGEETSLEMPLVNYPGYEAVGNQGKMKIITGENNLLYVIIPGGYEGSLKVSYVGFWYWRVAELISFISLIGFIYICRKDCKQSKEICIVHETSD